MLFPFRLDFFIYFSCSRIHALRLKSFFGFTIFCVQRTRDFSISFYCFCRHFRWICWGKSLWWCCFPHLPHTEGSMICGEEILVCALPCSMSHIFLVGTLPTEILQLVYFSFSWIWMFSNFSRWFLFTIQTKIWKNSNLVGRVSCNSIILFVLMGVVS